MHTRAVSQSQSQSKNFAAKYGVELEFMGLDRQQIKGNLVRRFDLWSSVRDGVKDEKHRLWEVKREFTQSDMMEIASPILENQSDLEQLQKVATVIQDAGGWVAKNTGMHIHVNARDLPVGVIHQFLVLMHQVQDPLYALLHVYSVRREFCKKLQTDDLIAVLKGPSDTIYDIVNHHPRPEKNSLVNLANLQEMGIHTLEVRCFNGTLNPAMIGYNVGFVMAVMQAAKQPPRLVNISEGSVHGWDKLHELGMNREEIRREILCEGLSRDEAADLRSILEEILARSDKDAPWLFETLAECSPQIVQTLAQCCQKIGPKNRWDLFEYMQGSSWLPEHLAPGLDEDALASLIDTYKNDRTEISRRTPEVFAPWCDKIAEVAVDIAEDTHLLSVLQIIPWIRLRTLMVAGKSFGAEPTASPFVRMRLWRALSEIPAAQLEFVVESAHMLKDHLTAAMGIDSIHNSVKLVPVLRAIDPLRVKEAVRSVLKTISVRPSYEEAIRMLGSIPR